MTDRPDVLVLRKAAHGMPIEQYAAALRERLPHHEVTLARTPEQEREGIRDAEIVTGMWLTDDLLDEAEALRLFACGYAGTGHLPRERLAQLDVTVTNASGVHGPNIGEHVLGAILAFSRRFHEGFRRQRRNEWRSFETHELQGSTVTVVGLGAIGESTVNRLAGFDVETIGVRYSPEKGGPTDRVVGFEDDDLHDALAETEYLVLACPLTETTQGLIGTSELVTLPPEAVVVNVARGPVLDTDALVTALQRGWIRGASLDVTDPEPLPADHELWDLGNVQITPHNAGHTPEYYGRLADIVASNVRHVTESGEYDGLANQVPL
ncbi:D-2-hydroxyacid dehydrogenase [Haloarchaeobius iranensis]|uniref:Phosphoglycerate dehydrogenase n=1 Tax=Haloarchaeobius iranensis TaxID=996166 RepID=A0A1G9W712_9EURY|nr:D-2-hydroxyacid dehydrogenase [Haloarchaeobius iranensis]SDM80027.1 Phosphoglycerate dehydrogenase [Haloarchaeobius iranensis]